MGRECLLLCGSLLCVFGTVLATFGYYKMFTPYGTGDTIIQTWTGHKGPDYNQPQRKWIVECLDGEAVIGILDNGDDFTRMWYVWCKFMFPYKPPAQGRYPYYPSCHVRNYTTQYFCYHSAEHEKTVNTFVTGFYGKQWNFILNRQISDDMQPYKCCKTPHGYYLDYTACYYQPTHDQYWEYYDSPSYFVVYCATGYVMTGITRRVNPYTKPDYHIEWIQCCRLGFGVPPLQPPPSNGSSYSLPYYNNITAYNYQRSVGNGAGPSSRFIVDPRELDGDHEAPDGKVPNAWPTTGNNWPMTGVKEETGSDPQKPDLSDVPYENKQLKEFFTPEGGSSTIGPVASSAIRRRRRRRRRRQHYVSKMRSLTFPLTRRWRPSFVEILCCSLLPAVVVGTNMYYGMYKSFGTGDTVITTYHADGGTVLPHRKWQVECFDGEAAVGIADNIWDFGALTYVWCKFLFPYKPPSQGLYPYYPHCHVMDYASQQFCYSRANHSLTANTFVTGFFDSDFVFWTWSPTDVKQPYKCCRTPKGYYIDYISCYYVPTHDLYFEYYDGNYFIVMCATGYVITGVGEKVNPINLERRIDWIQCCRVGFGAVMAVSPPIINVQNRPAAFTSSSSVSPINIPSGYAHQYRKKRSAAISSRTRRSALEDGNSTISVEDALLESEHSMPKQRAFGFDGQVNHHDVPPIFSEYSETNIPLSVQNL
ncbi:hypothetical protein BV898_05043 [Hypsibius exemplaris]|uniref:Uncharacterized protein n=1 Tax=Hypsibius exemplaris TaxID=2072580 RepID=A0A1W0X0K1_HYPEX|nr:hypothetical protein BV898_05043 [Hypsibius exemplaris]